jgi:hypothetical protein
LAENGRVELKSSVNESSNLPGSIAPYFVAFQAEGPKKDERRIKEGSKNGQIAAAETTHRAGNVANER